MQNAKATMASARTFRAIFPVLLCIPAIGISALIAFLFIHELYIVAILRDTEFYPFGGEGPTAEICFWRTEAIYLLHTSVVFVLSCAILLYSIRAARKRTLKAAVYALAMTLLYVVALVADAHIVLWLQ